MEGTENSGKNVNVLFLYEAEDPMNRLVLSSIVNKYS